MKRSLWLTILMAGAAGAQEAPPGGPLPVVPEVKIEDFPGDDGSSVMAIWNRTPDNDATTYELQVALANGGPWYTAGQTSGKASWKSDQTLPFWMWRKQKDVHCMVVASYMRDGEEVSLLAPEDEKTHKRPAMPAYWWRMVSKNAAGTRETPPVQVSPTGNIFNPVQINAFLYMIGYAAVVLAFIWIARGRQLFIRRIPGLDAVDEAVGRATEMGKPIFYQTGSDSMTSVSTIAATLILGEIAKKVATYDTQIKVPHRDPIVMAVCQEITREAYISAGRPDAYRPESNFFVTDDQFGYTAAVDGMMVREKPAACFYMGYYYAESLLLAETGASTGAIQVAGTDADHQLPFFFTACDYTLIGEELYAAGAYLSREPVLVGTLRSQDVGKALILSSILVLGIIATIAQWVSAGETDKAKRWSWKSLWVFDLVRGN